MERSDRATAERALRRAVLAGDAEAWRCLYDLAFDPVHAFVHRRSGGDAERVPEVLQECWTIAVRRLRTFDPSRGPFTAWVRGIAENVLRNEWRRTRRRRERERPIADVGTLPAVEPAPVCVAEHVAMALATLPDPYRIVLRAKYLEDRSVAEIAEGGGETPKAVESRLSRARSAFRSAYRRFVEAG